MTRKLVAVLFGAWALCAFKAWHDVRRDATGVFRCRDCKRNFGSLSEAGLGNDDVTPSEIRKRGW